MSDSDKKPESEAATATTSPEEERAAAAEAQNLPEGSVPEQRPQASQSTDPNDKSDLTKQIEERSDVPDDSAMDQAAYDRADSDAQKKAAAKVSFSEGPMVGNMVRSTKGPHEGRIFAVTRIVQDDSVGDAIRRLSGSVEQNYNQPREVEVRAIGDERDGELLVLGTEKDGLIRLNEDFRGSRAGRLH